MKIRFNSPTHQRTNLLNLEYPNTDSDSNGKIKSNKPISLHSFKNSSLHTKQLLSKATTGNYINIKSNLYYGLFKNIGHEKQKGDYSIAMEFG